MSEEVFWCKNSTGQCALLELQEIQLVNGCVHRVVDGANRNRRGVAPHIRDQAPTMGDVHQFYAQKENL
jgi:hypothetical protein